MPDAWEPAVCIIDAPIPDTAADDMAVFYFEDQSEKLARAKIGVVSDDDE